MPEYAMLEGRAAAETGRPCSARDLDATCRLAVFSKVLMDHRANSLNAINTVGLPLVATPPRLSRSVGSFAIATRCFKTAIPTNRLCEPDPTRADQLERPTGAWCGFLFNDGFAFRAGRSNDIKQLHCHFSHTRMQEK
jgi:hypothetical protein